jgi:serine/threonine protein kinase
MAKYVIDGTVYQLMSGIKFQGGTSDCFLLRRMGVGKALQPLFYLFKKLHASIADNSEYSGLLEREYTLGKSLQNVNVVSYKDYIEDARGIVMNFVNGSTLEDFLVADSAKTDDAAYFGKRGVCHVVKFCFQILSGLKAMHDRNFCHCDMTSRNILMTSITNNAVIIDLGMAHCMGDGAIIGTSYQYCAPEMNSGYADGRSDIYMFGQLLQRITTSLPMFAPIVERCMAADPECRYQSADEVATAILTLCLSGQDQLQSFLLSSLYITYFPQPYSYAV